MILDFMLLQNSIQLVTYLSLDCGIYPGCQASPNKASAITILKV